MVITHNRASKPIWRSNLNLYAVTFLAGRIDYNEESNSRFFDTQGFMRHGRLDDYLKIRFNETEIGNWCTENNIKTKIKENDVLRLWFKNFSVTGFLTKQQMMDYILRFQHEGTEFGAEWLDDDPYGYPNAEHAREATLSAAFNMPLTYPDVLESYNRDKET